MYYKMHTFSIKYEVLYLYSNFTTGRSTNSN